MFRQISLICLLAVILILAACGADNLPENPPDSGPGVGSIEAEADREGAFVLRDDQREALAVDQPVGLSVGEGVAVDASGRATIRLVDLLTAELLQAGEVVLQEVSANGQATAITIRQSAGLLLGQFNPDGRRNHRLTIETEFATVTTAGARFLIVQEASSSLEWIVGLGPAEDEVQVTAAGVTQTVPGGSARWVAPMDAPGESISVDPVRVQAWLDGVRNEGTGLTLGEVLMSPANMVGSPASLASLPGSGQPFELEESAQGAVELTLDPVGLFGNPGYALEDCNGDGSRDIAIRTGILRFDFRPVLARVLAVDVTVLNRGQPNHGALSALGPAGDEMGRQLVEVGAGERQTLGLRASRPFHYAELAMSDGCFIGFSLTPPGPSGAPAGPRAIITGQPDGVVINILQTPQPQNLPERTQLEAAAVGTTENAGSIHIDGDPGDWDALTQQSGLDWTRFDAVIYDNGCANRYPGSTLSTDLGGQVRFAYNERFLYVAFRVDDDGYAGYTGEGQLYFLGDSPQLSLDADLLGDFNDPGRSQDDWQIDFQPGLDSPRAALWQLGSLTSREFTEAWVATSSASAGYFLEAALPWQSFGVSPQPGERLGLAANVNDNDTPGANVQECIISTAPQRRWDSPPTWNILLLRPNN